MKKKKKIAETEEHIICGAALLPPLHFRSLQQLLSIPIDRFKKKNRKSQTSVPPHRFQTEGFDLVVMASAKEDQLAASLNDLFTNVSHMIKGELQGTNNVLELLEKMNLRVGEEYKGFGDVASGLRVFVEQLKSKTCTFDDCIQQLDAIEQHVTEFEAVISMLDKYVSMLESKMKSVYQAPLK